MQNVLFIPGLLCTAELYAPQLKALRDVAHCQVADHTVAASMADIAAIILRNAPKTFALCGLSMGGYISLEIMRQAPERVTRLALLDTAAKPDLPERRVTRMQQVAAVEKVGFASLTPMLMPLLIHPRRLTDATLVATIERMSAMTGVTHFARQQQAIAGRADSRPSIDFALGAE